jgi:hypothetical protein
MRVKIKDQYIDRFEDFIDTLPKDAITIKRSLDEEIQRRVSNYKNGKMKTTPFMEDLDEIRESLVSRL